MWVTDGNTTTEAVVKRMQPLLGFTKQLLFLLSSLPEPLFVSVQLEALQYVLCLTKFSDELQSGHSSCTGVTRKSCCSAITTIGNFGVPLALTDPHQTHKPTKKAILGVKGAKFNPTNDTNRIYRLKESIRTIPGVDNHKQASELLFKFQSLYFAHSFLPSARHIRTIKSF